MRFSRASSTSNGEERLELGDAGERSFFCAAFVFFREAFVFFRAAFVFFRAAFVFF